jgi:paraquat-inducible protein A
MSRRAGFWPTALPTLPFLLPMPEQIAAPSPTLIACPECDLLQHELTLPPHGVALCGRCNAYLYRESLHGLDYTLAFTLSAAVFFLFANIFPLVRIELQGTRTSATLFGAVRALASQELVSMSILVFVTTMLVPALEIAAMLYILLPLRLGQVVPGVPSAFRFVQRIRPWGMVEVFMLGILVSVVRLAAFTTVIPGIALWSFALLMMSLSAAAHFFNPRDLWGRVWLHG